MLEGTTNTQKIMMGALAVFAVAGWIAVFFVNQSGSDTEAALAAVKTDLAKKSDELTAAEKKLSTTAEAAGSLEDITKRRATAKTDLQTASSPLTALKPQLESVRTELDSLTPKLNTAKAEYDALNLQIGEAKSELDDLFGAVEKMREQVSKNRPSGSTVGRVEVLPKPSDIAAAPAVMPQETPVAEVTERAVAPIPESAAKAAEIAALPKTVTPSPQKSRLAEEVKARFDRLDENDDGKISRTEFNFGKIMLLSLADSDWDGFVSFEETVLSADFYKQVDADGDGKLSEIEFVDAGAKAFKVADANRDGFVTHDELTKILRTPAK